ncbi:MAG: hypothetical protein ABSF08_00115 [Candidatus Cybelea sp.]
MPRYSSRTTIVTAALCFALPRGKNDTQAGPFSMVGATDST